LELCPNLSLNDWVKHRKRLTEPEAAYFMLDLLDAVEYLHGNSIIHCDLKPHNLFLDKNMRIKVGDMGLATRIKTGATEKCNRLCGTPNYMAPEVLRSKETRAYSYEIDIWAIGVILYTMLVGKAPFEEPSVQSTYQRILYNKYDYPAHVSISPQARNLIASILQSKPEKR